MKKTLNIHVVQDRMPQVQPRFKGLVFEDALLGVQEGKRAGMSVVVLRVQTTAVASASTRQWSNL